MERSQLRLIIAGLTDGVILVEPDQTISWANDAALAMHGVDDLVALGRDVKDYRRNFRLTYRNKHSVDKGNYPLERVVAGEAFDDVVVEVTRAGCDHPDWVHRIRSLVINDPNGEPDCLVLIIKDVTDRYEAEERFQRTFARKPRAGRDLPAIGLEIRQSESGLHRYDGVPARGDIGGERPTSSTSSRTPSDARSQSSD